MQLFAKARPKRFWTKGAIAERKADNIACVISQNSRTHRPASYCNNSDCEARTVASRPEQYGAAAQKLGLPLNIC